MRKFNLFSCIALAVLMAACTAPPAANTAAPPAAATPAAQTASVALPPVATPGAVVPLDGYIKAHDPVMAKDGAKYYVFTTGGQIPILCSPDMKAWEFCGRVFKQNPKWIADAVPGVGDLWAPDISFFGGKWHLYYAASTFGKNQSAIGLATNTTLNMDDPNYKWVDEGLVIQSKPNFNWNAIDPNLALDENNAPWLAFGSYWTGIKLQKLDAATGKPAQDAQLVALAGGRPGPDAIEAAFIIRRGGYFYLFVSFDACCQGVNSTYNIRVGRSTKIDGPYVDRDGKDMLAGGGTLVLAGSKRWRGPGHNAIYTENGVDYLVYHAYDADEAGVAKLHIEPLGWDAQGWPVAPSAAAK